MILDVRIYYELVRNMLVRARIYYSYEVRNNFTSRGK